MHTMTSNIERTATTQSGTLRGVTDKVTSNGFRMNVAGMDYSRFALNPVLLWEHGTDPMHREPIGKISSIIRTDASIDFVPKYADTLWAKEISQLDRGGFLPGNSIGWIPTELVPYEDHIYIASWTLIELSKVVIPADMNALTL